MAITYAGALENATGGASPKTVAVDIGTRTNGLLVVALCFYDNNMGTPAVTYAGTSMTLASEYPTTSGVYHVALYYLANPTNGSNNLVITWTGTSLSMYVLASWYDGAAQTSPLDQVVTGSGSTDPSLSITPTENNELIVSHYFSSANDELAVGSGETKINGYDFGGEVTGGSYVIQTTAASQTVDWSGVDDTWYMVVVSFKQAVASGTTISLSDTGSGVDAIGGVNVSLALADTGSGVESFSSSASLELSDSGAGGDALAAILAALGIAEAGAGVDSLGINAAVVVSDVGNGADAVNQVMVTLSVNDAGYGADVVNLVTEIIKQVSDSGAGSDSLSIAISPITIFDNGVGADSLTIQATISIADFGSGADAINLLQAVYKVVSEAAIGTDTIGNVAVSLEVPDSGAGVDLISQIMAWVVLAETGSGVDVAVAYDSAVRIATISFTIARRTIASAFVSRVIDFELASREINFDLSRREIDFSLARREMDFDF